ncbi:16787_t:CDS:2 [Dentiscutata erythropus]|uniref:16787_t:CDS:1 n=1 Tax=Dentiscutata erythropus TaxID=1348616 RepID=A0A9N9IFY1_9GLOM|nr:16787_t:CDS:2 [Dentiscutata erythropus]
MITYFILSVIGLLSIVFFSEASMFALFTILYPFLYLFDLYARHQRRKLAQPWPAKDKVILITGASGGIGRSLAHVFAKQGSNLVLCARREEYLTNVANECREYGATKVITVKCDITNENEVSNLIKATEDSFNKLDCLILNAGVSMGEPFESISDYKIIKDIMDVNYFGSTNVAYQALKLLKNNKGSRIVVVDSLLGFISAPLRTGYCGSKFALKGFFESLQLEVWEYEMFVGTVVTNINDARLGKNSKPLNMKGAMSADECANIIYKGVCRGDKEIVFTTEGKIGRLMEGVFPDAWSYLTKKFARKAIAGDDS